MSSSDIVGGADGGAEPGTTRSVLLRVIPFLLWNEFGERLAFYGLVTNLIIYLTSVMGQTDADAAVSVNIFQGTCYLTPVVGAYLADCRYGRYKTILIFSWVYFAGLVLLTASAVSSAKSMAALYVALFTIALGTGGIKANNSTFGADQFDDENPRDQQEKQSFFNWFYFSINVGSLIASTAIVYVQENISWAIGFALPATAMLGAIVVLMAGQSRYKHVQPSNSPFERIARVTEAAWKERRRVREMGRGNRGWKHRDRGRRSDAGTSAGASDHSGDNIEAETEPLVPGAQDSGRGTHWLDAAIGQHTAEEVDEVKLFYALFPVFFATILFWTVYAQMQTFFVVQGSMMYRQIGSFVVPAASLSMMDTLAIVGLIPVYEKLFVPMFRRMGHPVTTLKRIGWGLVICSTSMIAAAAVERCRLGAARHSEPPPSIWLQVPMYVLVGAAEIGTSVGTMEFFYDKAPASMRSSASALQLLSVCIGSYLSSLLVVIVQSVSTFGGGAGWLPDDLNAGRLDAFFLLLAALMALNALFFVWVCRRYYSHN